VLGLFYLELPKCRDGQLIGKGPFLEGCV